jgi:hypothetical protein
MSDEATFRVTGAVVRSNVAASGKAAWVTLDVLSGERSKKLDFIAFGDAVQEVGALAKGATVELTGQIDIQPVKDKAGAQVKVDGFARWFPMLVVRAVTSSKTTANPRHREEKAPGPDLGDQDDADNDIGW